MQTRRKPLTTAAPRPAQAPNRIKVMVVDDSLTVRTVFARMIASDQSLELAATANSAEAAIAQVAVNDIDVILLDLEMPGMGGLKALPQLLRERKEVEILVVSSLTERGAEHTLRALSLGAADTMLKPRPGGFDEAYRLTLLQKIQALGGLDQPAADLPTVDAKHASPDFASPLSLSGKRPEIIAFGASTGGIHALTIVLEALPSGFQLPIVITQHLPETFVPMFARQVQAASCRPTVIAKPGTPVRRGEIAVASGDGHMEFALENDVIVARVSTKPASSGCLPSVDPMFASIAEVFGGRAIGVILSGMGRDGALGAKALSDAGGTIIAQNADSSAVWGMPGAVVTAGIADACLPPEKIAEAITSAAGALAWK